MSIDDVEEYVVGNTKLNVGRDVISVGQLMVDEVLLDHIFSLHITTV